jgi:hypothetical protein
MESSGLYIVTLKERENTQILENMKSKVLESVMDLGGKLVGNSHNITANDSEEVNNVLFINLPHDDYDRLLINPDIETAAPLVIV